MTRFIELNGTLVNVEQIETVRLCGGQAVICVIGDDRPRILDCTREQYDAFRAELIGERDASGCGEL